MNRCAEHPRGDPCLLLPEWAQAQIATLQSQLAEREAELKRRELKIQQLTLELAHHRRIRFGARSEGLGAEQRELFLDSRAEDEAAILAELEQQRAARPARQAKRTGRHPLPAALPRIEHRHEPASCTCGACGAGLVKIGEDISEQLDVEPARFFVHRHIRPQYACRRCETVTAAPVPASLIDGGLAAPGLHAWVLIQKYRKRPTGPPCGDQRGMIRVSMTSSGVASTSITRPPSGNNSSIRLWGQSGSFSRVLRSQA